MTVNLPTDLVMPAVIVTFVVWLFIHTAFAFGVVYDAKRLPHRRDPVFVGRWTWFVTILAGGPLFALAYWLIHHSVLSPFTSNEISFSHRHTEQ